MDLVCGGGEGSDAIEGIARAEVVRSPHFEQREGPFGAVGRPDSQGASIVLAQGRGT